MRRIRASAQGDDGLVLLQKQGVSCPPRGDLIPNLFLQTQRLGIGYASEPCPFRRPWLVCKRWIRAEREDYPSDSSAKKSASMRSTATVAPITPIP